MFKILRAAIGLNTVFELANILKLNFTCEYHNIPKINIQCFHYLIRIEYGIQKWPCAKTY